jgi:hypothetical protein
MTEAPSHRLLVVANRTESAPLLLEEVGRRARTGCQIALVVPPERDPDAPDWTPEQALRLVGRAAGDRPVTLLDCGEDAAATIGRWWSAASATRSCSARLASITRTGIATICPSGSRRSVFR